MFKNSASGKIDEQLARYSDSKSFKVYFLLSAIGLLLFFTVAFTFSFKDKVFQAFFQKPFSFAQTTDDTPIVDLVAGVGSSFKKWVINVESGKNNISLKWKTQNKPTSCLGRFWSNVKKEDPWTGEKDKGGGQYKLAENLETGIYVYSINCSNESGDSTGSSIVINVGAKPSNLPPHITSFKTSSDDKNNKLTVTWSNINTDTAYGVCVASGSWPTIYQNTTSLEVKEEFVTTQAKIYKYFLLCANETGYDTEEVAFTKR